MRNKIDKMTRTALCVAIVSVLSQLSIPIGTTFLTLQIFAVALVGYLLGSKASLVSVTVYIFVGAVGAPVFAGFRGGFSVLIGYTGGFIFGFIPLCVLCGIAKCGKITRVLFGFLGVIVCHLLGVVQYMLLSDLDFISSFTLVSLPYILKDMVLIVCACALAEIISKRIKS